MSDERDELLSTVEAAMRLGLSPSRVWRLIRAGRLPATRHGHDWWVRAADLAAFAAQERPRGWPRGRPRPRRRPRAESAS